MRFVIALFLLCVTSPAQDLRIPEQPVTQTAPRVIFALQLFYERGSDSPFATQEAEKLRALVSTLAPHVDLTVTTHPAPAIVRTRFSIGQTRYAVPNQAPTSPGASALLLTHEAIGAQGLSGPLQGCVSIELMREKSRLGGNSADMLIHEWLHTIVGQRMGNRVIPHPHENARHGYQRPSRQDAAGQDNWDDWYAYVLR